MPATAHQPCTAYRMTTLAADRLAAWLVAYTDGGWPQEGHSCCLLQRAAAEPSWQNRVKATPWHCWLQSVREKKKERHNRARAPPRRRECSPLPYDQAARYTRSDRLSNTLIPSRSQPSVGEGSHRRGSAGPVVTGLPLGSTSDEDAWLTEDLA